MLLLNNEGVVITRSRKIVSVLIAVGCLVGVLFINQDAIIKQLRDWRLLPELERVTELYFTDYMTLPKSFAAGSHQTVSFTIHNLEHQAVTYYYRIIATPDSGAEQVLGNGTLMLAHNDSRRSKVDIVIPALKPRISVKVELYYLSTAPGHNTETMQTQSIDYWAAVTDSGADDGKAIP